MGQHIDIPVEIRSIKAQLDRLLEAYERQQDPQYTVYTCNYCGRKWDHAHHVTDKECSACC